MFAGLSRGWVFRHHSLLTRASSWRTAATADQAATRPSRHGEGGEEGRERRSVQLKAKARCCAVSRSPMSATLPRPRCSWGEATGSWAEHQARGRLHRPCLSIAGRVGCGSAIAGMLAGRAGLLGLETRVCGGRTQPPGAHAADPEDLRSGTGWRHFPSFTDFINYIVRETGRVLQIEKLPK